MQNLYFNCGEFLPGKKPITPVIPILPVPVAPKIPAPRRPCCTVIPGPPAVPRPPLDEWVCVCAAPCTEDPTACLENRACMRIRDVPPGFRGGRAFSSFQECVDRGYGEPPCWKCGVRCQESRVPCPPPRPDLFKEIIRECIRCPNAREQTGDCAVYPSMSECRHYCVNEFFDCPGFPRPPITGPRPRPPDTGGISISVTRPRPPITPTDYFKCIIEREFCPPPREDILKTIKQRCEVCFTDFGNGIGRRRDGSIGPRPGDCPQQTGSECATRGGTNGGPCRDIPVNVCPIGPITEGPTPVTPGRRPPNTGGISVIPAPPAPIGPITPTDSYNCEREYCPPPRQTLLKSRKCVVCFTDYGNGTGRRRDGSIGSRPPDCPPKTRRECEEEDCSTLNNICPTNPITGGEISVSVSIVGVQGGQGGIGILSGPQKLKSILDLNSQNLTGQRVELNLGIQTNDLFGTQIVRKQRVINIDEEARKAKSSDESGQNYQSIYHREYNLFQYTPINSVNFVSNDKYLNIFRDIVPEEVAYILNISDSSGIWTEYPYTQLTKEKMIVALQFNLLNALSNIHYIDGTQVSLDFFLESIRMLLAEARLGEFDSQFFLDLAKSQENDEFLVIQNSIDKTVQEQAALGILAAEAINSDPNFYEDEFKKLNLLRTRRLNTDIKALIPLSDFAGVETPVPLVDPGLQVVTLEEAGLPIIAAAPQNTNYAPLGEGHGYYISATLLDSTIVPIRTQNQLSSTYYVPPATRDIVLKFFNIDPALSLRTTALIGKSEFDSNFTTSAIQPKYYALNLATVGDVERVNPLVREVSGSYTKLTTEADITAHTRTYGTAITKVFVNYDDPFLIYADESGEIEFSQSDVSFEGSYPDTGAINNQILSRNIAFALILIPVRGSRFNPFSQKSQLITYEYPYTRELTVINHIHFSTDRVNVPALEQSYLFDKTGEFKIGLVEENNNQNIIFSWNSSSIDYSGLYFSGGVYGDEQPGKESPVTRRLVYDLIETSLSGNYGYLSSLTWWDLYRRLRAKDMAEIAFQIPKKFLEKLANGSRGYRIRNVMQREQNTGSDLVDQDNVILTVEDRKPNILL